MNIPINWSFDSPGVADNFDTHVREQLPWYDMATGMVAHIVRHYLPENGLIYDIGASTGNIGESVSITISSRNANFIAIEKSEEMARRYRGPGKCIVADATDYEFLHFDVAVCFLVLMFMPITKRKAFLTKLCESIRPGGAIIVFDKVEYHDGYLSTVMHRLTMAGKVATGVLPDEIIKKELSLSGVQRPLSNWIIQCMSIKMVEIFRFGEFAGWIGTRPE